MKQLLKIAIRNIQAHWKQSLSATISIASGFISLTLFSGYMLDVDRIYTETYRELLMYGDFLVEKPGARTSEGRSEPWKFGISKEEQDKVSKILSSHQNDIEVFTRFIHVTGAMNNGTQQPIFIGFGIDKLAGAQTRGKGWKWNTLAGVPLEEGKSTVPITLGQGLANTLGCRRAQKEFIRDSYGRYVPKERPFICDQGNRFQVMVTTHSGQMNALNFEMVGILDGLFKDVDNRLVHMPLELAQTLNNTDTISFFSVKLKSRPKTDEFVAKLNSEFKAQGLSVTAERWEKNPIGEFYVKTTELLGVFRDFVILVIIVICGLSVSLTFFKTVKERTKEIGTLRSMGFFASEVVTLFCFESALLCTFGSVIGLIFGLITTSLLNSLSLVYKAGILAEPVLFRIGYSATLYFGSYVFLLFLSFTISFLISRKIANGNIHESLQHA